MGTIFVAYGQPGHRKPVLEFAAERASASDDELLVYHVQESKDETAKQLREEIEQVIEETDPTVAYTVEVNTRAGISDQTNVSKQKRLTDRLLELENDFEYVVMGDVERGTVAELAHSSMTKAVLETHALPVLLVPV
ncbi:universal stress protein [Halorhabdus rudnickae]|uniref:universal stress protein n=1 Tax=Halorhabdus rudnickae TaxID=1775544 RepID=UPI0010833D92|nr:universal stress protein [Halorhabdus rudnickae]